MIDVNYLALIVAAVINMALGTLWFGPLFGKQWIALMGFTPEKIAEAKQKGMGKSYFLAFVSSLLTAFVLSLVITYASGFLQESGAMLGARVGFWLWLGIAVPITLSSVLWEGKPWKWWLISAGYYLVQLKLLGAILAAWM